MQLKGKTCTHRTEVNPVTTLFLLMPTFVVTPHFLNCFLQKPIQTSSTPTIEDATTQWINRICDGKVATTTVKRLQAVTD